MKQSKRLYLVGHSGSGKALVAKTVAEKLGWQFIDEDFALEFRIGRNLDEILGTEGQERFSQCQSEILLSHLYKEHIVVATDASIVCCERNRELLAQGLVVFLKVSPYMQLERSTRNPASLLTIPDFTTFLEKQHLERDHLYDQVADLVINSDTNQLDEHVQSITNLISHRSPQQPRKAKLSIAK